MGFVYILQYLSATVEPQNVLQIAVTMTNLLQI